MKSAPPRFVEPMMARLTDRLPSGNDWAYEVKFDGIRALAIKNKKHTILFSRRHHDITAEFPDIARAISALPVADLVVDGEIIAKDAQGRSEFQLLQNRKNNLRQELLYVVFDLIHVAGHDLTGFPLWSRRNLLEELLPGDQPPLCLSRLLPGQPKTIWAHVQKRGLEGVIAKRKDSDYECGRRSGSWCKVKAVNEQEFVIGGFTEPQGARRYFGSVLVGYYDAHKLKLAAAVGTGYNALTLESLHRRFQELVTDHCPFDDFGVWRNSKGAYLLPSQLRHCTWLKPALVCQVKFQAWTAEGILRQPVFLGLREDKRPEEVVRETPVK